MAAAAAGGGGGALERRLLLGSLAAADADSLPTGTGVPALALLEAGDYAGALAAALRSAWAAGGGAADVATPESTPDWFEAAAPLFKQALTGDGPADAASAADQLLLAAAAALCLFAQANLVGPVLPLPECPFDWMDAPEETEWRQRRQQQQEQQRGGGGGGGESSASDAGFGRDSTSPGDRCARRVHASPGRLCRCCRAPLTCAAAMPCPRPPSVASPPTGGRLRSCVRMERTLWGASTARSTCCWPASSC